MKYKFVKDLTSDVMFEAYGKTENLDILPDKHKVFNVLFLYKNHEI